MAELGSGVTLFQHEGENEAQNSRTDPRYGAEQREGDGEAEDDEDHLDDGEDQHEGEVLAMGAEEAEDGVGAGDGGRHHHVDLVLSTAVASFVRQGDQRLGEQDDRDDQHDDQEDEQDDLHDLRRVHLDRNLSS